MMQLLYFKKVSWILSI